MEKPLDDVERTPSGKLPMTSVGLAILSRWKSQAPKMVAALKASGELEEVLYSRQELVADAIQDAMAAGRTHDQALEIGRSMMDPPAAG